MCRLLFGIPHFVTDSTNTYLRLDFTTDEVCLAVQGMAPTKATGSDGMFALFYKKFWHILGPDVSEFCLHVLNDGGSLTKINDTNILLIPKQRNPHNMNRFRLISLCNVLFKIISKVLVNRLQKVMPNCIDEG